MSCQTLHTTAQHNEFTAGIVLTWQEHCRHSTAGFEALAQRPSAQLQALVFTLHCARAVLKLKHSTNIKGSEQFIAGLAA
jgi:hypothetical protein